MKYSVLIKPRIMIRIDGVEAGSHEEAVVKAIEKYESSAQDLIGRDLENYNRNDPEGSFRYMEFAESEDIFEALVDEEGDEDFDNSKWYMTAMCDPQQVVPHTPELEADIREVLKRHVENNMAADKEKAHA